MYVSLVHRMFCRPKLFGPSSITHQAPSTDVDQSHHLSLSRQSVEIPQPSFAMLLLRQRVTPRCPVGDLLVVVDHIPSCRPTRPTLHPAHPWRVSQVPALLLSSLGHPSLKPQPRRVRGQHQMLPRHRRNPASMRIHWSPTGIVMQDLVSRRLLRCHGVLSTSLHRILHPFHYLMAATTTTMTCSSSRAVYQRRRSCST